MNNRNRIIIGILLILAGLLIGFGPISSYFKSSAAASSSDVFGSALQANTAFGKDAPTKELKQGKPTRLVIESLNIDIAVADGVYNASTKEWTLSKDKAHYAVVTPLANNTAGNTFIYGHNRKEVFNKLFNIKVGDKVTLYTDTGYKFTYVYDSSYETDPTDLSLFNYKGSPILTLQTCSGMWYQNRQLFTFTLREVAG